jgi:hypothetical protein
VYLRKRRTIAMRLNLALAAFAVVSLALTSGCAAKFGEDAVDDPTVEPKSGDLASASNIRTPSAADDSEVRLAIDLGAPLDRTIDRGTIQGVVGPAAGAGESLSIGTQLKRSLVHDNGSSADVDERQGTTNFE